MSLQTSDLPSPSLGALNRIATKHDARHRRALAAARRREEVAEAAALGVAIVTKPAVDRSWTDEEEAVIRALHPHYAEMARRLPHRSRNALRHRASLLGLVKTRKAWTVKEEATLRRLWAQATVGELLAALPGRDVKAIDHKGRRLGLGTRGKAPLPLTGNTLCDAIRDRARVLGYAMPFLDRISRTGTYFAGREWRGKGGHRTAPMTRAVNALGGVLHVEWPD